ncbi:MAG: LacI family transcriptional regulator [Lachnospiraceae bacterium]|nr:LacI family transcriptional regulator [Lachnospiraceae bacterium]
MNIYDISEKAGVSIATVSRVINGNAKVSEKTRQKILAIIEETGYTPNAFARGLGLNTMKTIGILCADCSDAYLASAIYHFERELRSHDYDVILCCTGYEQANKEKYLNLLMSKHVDAVILAGSNFIDTGSDPDSNSYIRDAAGEIPVIILNGFVDLPGVYCVLSDDQESVYSVTASLLEQGATSPLFLSRSDSYSGLQKKKGFIRALKENGMKDGEKRVLSTPGTIEENTELLLKKAAAGLVFDAVICSEDELAIAALKYAKQAGRLVPKDLSIVGFNNSKMSLCCEPELTTIDNRLSYACASAVDLLMKVMAGEDVPGKLLISSNLVVRGTTKALK